MPDDAAFLKLVHERLAAFYDLDRWHWQDDVDPLDVCLGAILVQHTAWGNVEKALANLDASGARNLSVLQALSEEELALLVRPAGTPLTKARRIKTLVELIQAQGGFDGLFDRPEAELRTMLLAINGIGPETADVILLYGARLPAIVHDAYTARLMRRLGAGPIGDRYVTWRDWLDRLLPRDESYRRAHHAAIVVHCKELCRVKPRCQACPLADLCQYAQASEPSELDP